MTKICKTCKVEKPLSEFHKQPGGKFGVRTSCALCATKKSIHYNNNHKEEIKQYYLNNKEKLLKQHKLYHTNHKEHVKEQTKNYRERKRNQIKKQQKQWRISHKEFIRDKEKTNYHSNLQFNGY
jgi:hypothetical protein